MNPYHIILELFQKLFCRHTALVHFNVTVFEFKMAKSVLPLKWKYLQFNEIYLFDAPCRSIRKGLISTLPKIISPFPTMCKQR